MAKSTVAVAMISRNEEAAVGKVIADIRANVPHAEIVLVDSSTDRTAAIAEAAGARVIRQLPPRGYGPAMQAALLASSRDVIVTMDCDGTYPASAIVALVDLIDAGFDVVNASRLWYRPAAMPLPNYLANATFAVATRAVHGLAVTDVHSGMRAYRRSMLDEVEFLAQGPALPVELLIKPARLGYRVAEVGIEYGERIGATGLDRFRSTVWTFRRIGALVRVGHRVRPSQFRRIEPTK